MWDTLFFNASVATMRDGSGRPYGLIPDAAVGISDGKIAWVGETREIADSIGDLAAEIHDVDGDLITPALIDCHTHLIFAGDRSQEFEARQLGASYADISRRGGGIAATVEATRNASENELLDLALTRLDDMLGFGVSTVEIKSGYGLDLDTELKMLQVAREIEVHRDVRVKTTFLGAHALPPEFECKDEYIDFLCEQVLPAGKAAGLIDAVDAYCEAIAFSPSQVERLFQAAAALNLPVKLHAEQLSNQDGAALAAKYGALSADHLEYLTPASISAMAASGTTAVLLPGAFYFLKEKTVPPVEDLRKAGVPIAVATDCNPGTSPMTSLLLAMNMACVFFGLTPEEALAGVTRHAAAALGLDELGTIEVGNYADLAIWDVQQPSALASTIGQNPLLIRVFEGDICR